MPNIELDLSGSAVTVAFNRLLREAEELQPLLERLDRPRVG